MNRRPGHVTVTVETGYCTFCGRPRNLRSEAHQLGTLVRTILTCETCHRTLSSTIGVATEEPERAQEPVAAAPAVAPETPAKNPPAKKAAAKKATAAKKTAAAKKPAAKTAKTPAKKAASKTK